MFYDFDLISSLRTHYTSCFTDTTFSKSSRLFFSFILVLGVKGVGCFLSLRANIVSAKGLCGSCSCSSCNVRLAEPERRCWVLRSSRCWALALAGWYLLGRMNEWKNEGLASVTKVSLGPYWIRGSNFLGLEGWAVLPKLLALSTQL